MKKMKNYLNGLRTMDLKNGQCAQKLFLVDLANNVEKDGSII